MSHHPGLNGFQLQNCLGETQNSSCWPVLICFLGGFRLIKNGEPVLLRYATKTKTLLASLALNESQCISRDALLQTLWPDTETALAGQSLNSLVHSLRKLLSDTIGGEPPIVLTEDCYTLNYEAGIGVDTIWFEYLMEQGEQQKRSGALLNAVESFKSAATLYRGDLCAGTDTQSIIISEGLRAKYLTLLCHLADHFFEGEEYSKSLEYARDLLSFDPCREDAHRVMMRCYVRMGERTQALRQYRLCEIVLHQEFGMAPERATTALFDQIRNTPERV